MPDVESLIGKLAIVYRGHILPGHYIASGTLNKVAFGWYEVLDSIGPVLINPVTIKEVDQNVIVLWDD